MLKKNRFAIEDLQPFDGYHLTGDLWNGWEKPYFEWEIAREIVKWSNEWNKNDQLQIDAQKEIIIDLEYSEEPAEISGEVMQKEDGEKTLYGLGTGWWIWSLYSDKDNSK